MARGVVAERVATEVAALSGLSREKLVEFWEQSFGTSPPRSCGRPLLQLAAASVIQEKALGGLKPAVRRALDRVPTPSNSDAGGPRSRMGSDKTQSGSSLRPGARLVREWNGRTYHVDVVTEGFVWNGKTHRSLSAIARAITGAQWSGPRFFGL